MNTEKSPQPSPSEGAHSTNDAVLGEYVGSRFSEVWATVASDPYDVLPQKRIGFSTLFEFARKSLYGSALRTLSTRHDLLPTFDKLVHPIGICLRGTWKISEATPYTGYFRTGAQGLLIARASDNMGETRPGRLRFLGLAGKLYPTCSPQHEQPLRTAHFLTNENLVGSHTPHFAHASFSNDLLPFSLHADPRIKIPLGMLVAIVFAAAERATGHPPRPLFRPLYPIAELGEEQLEQAKYPEVVRLVGPPENRSVDMADLREELDIRHHPAGIRFEIQVSDQRSYLSKRDFRRIGEIHFTDSVASYSGDHRLHFAHAPARRGK
jgi:hypothetical protein